ncbi:MAG: YjbH domain-containing protein [Paracoccaceae bacterium]
MGIADGNPERCARLFGAAMLSVLAAAAATAAPPRPSLGLYGQTGLIDMPSAEMQPDGETSWSLSGFGPVWRGALNFQFLPGAELTLRYTSIEDWTAGGGSVFTDELDLKFRLLQETASLPALALGFRDVLGTGVKGAEYVVATKTLHPTLKASLGLGWGRLGSENGFDNPLGLLSGTFDTRPSRFGDIGQIRADQYFRGDAALFAGLEWRTPVRGLSFKAEYSSDDYRRTALNSALDVTAPFNFGLEYRLGNGIGIGGYLMHGSEVGFRVSLSGNPFRPQAPQDLGNGPAPFMARRADAPRGGGWASDPRSRDMLMQAIAEALSPDGIVVREAELSAGTVELRVENTRIRREPKAIGRVARVLAAGTPASVGTFRITLLRDGVPTTTAVVDRAAFERQIDRPDAGPRSWQSVELRDAPFRLDGPGHWIAVPERRFTWSLGPSLPVRFFSNENSVSYRLQLRGDASYRISPGFTLNGTVAQTLFEQTDSAKPLAPAGFPRVRTNYAAYEGAPGPELSRLSADYVFKISDATYGRLSAGYLERMFGGVSGEVLWKPVNQRWGLGAEVNYVRQRAFGDAFSFRDYEVVTGHGSLYWDTGFYDLEAQVNAGRYLGGDWGATLTLGRRFANGWEVAAYIVGTDATSRVSGIGNLDRGIRVTIPLRWTLPMETRSSVSADFNIGARDDGARLDVANRLYRTVRDTERGDLYQTWGAFWQ